MSLEDKDMIEHLMHESESDIEGIRENALKKLDEITVKEDIKNLKDIKYKETKKHNIIEMPDGFRFYVENKYEHLETVVSIFKDTGKTQINGKKYMNGIKLGRGSKLFILKVEMMEDGKKDVGLFEIKIVDKDYGDIKI